MSERPKRSILDRCYGWVWFKYQLGFATREDLNDVERCRIDCAMQRLLYRHAQLPYRKHVLLLLPFPSRIKHDRTRDAVAVVVWFLLLNNLWCASAYVYDVPGPPEIPVLEEVIYTSGVVSQLFNFPAHHHHHRHKHPRFDPEVVDEDFLIDTVTAEEPSPILLLERH